MCRYPDSSSAVQNVVFHFVPNGPEVYYASEVQKIQNEKQQMKKWETDKSTESKARPAEVTKDSNTELEREASEDEYDSEESAWGLDGELVEGKEEEPIAITGVPLFVCDGLIIVCVLSPSGV